MDIECCCLPEFKVNPPQTVTMMSALRACARARASVPYWSPPLPTVPGPTKRAWVRNGALTLVKQTGLLCSNVLRHRTDCLVWVHPQGWESQGTSWYDTILNRWPMITLILQYSNFAIIDILQDSYIMTHDSVCPTEEYNRIHNIHEYINFCLSHWCCKSQSETRL